MRFDYIYINFLHILPLNQFSTPHSPGFEALRSLIIISSYILVVYDISTYRFVLLRVGFCGLTTDLHASHIDSLFLGGNICSYLLFGVLLRRLKA